VRNEDGDMKVMDLKAMLTNDSLLGRMLVKVSLIRWCMMGCGAAFA
jgi:hypothetical protein